MKTLRILMLALLLPAFVMTACDKGGDDGKPTYTVTFNADGGTPAPAAQKVTEGEKATVPAAMTKAGYTFLHWSKDGAAAYDFATPVMANFTLTAQWEVVADPEIEIPDESELTQQAFADDETTGGFTFTAKSAWTATVTETDATRANLSDESTTRADGVKWLRLLRNGEETYSGAAGNFTLAIELDENYTGETRAAMIIIAAGDYRIAITVTQDGKTKEGTVPVADVLTKIPDAEFRAYCAENMAYWDTDHNGILSIEEAAAVGFIDFDSTGATSLEGIEYFTGLTELNCGGNQLTSLDVSKNTALTELFCDGNRLTSLDVSKNTALTVLFCNGNQLTSLDVSKNTALTVLFCFNNQLTSLDVSKNTALTELNCGGNPLTSLDVSKNTALTELSCAVNPLTSLDVSENTALTVLYCAANRLTSLDVSKNTALTTLICFSNPGNGTSFPITVWFDEGSPIPSGFPSEGWSFGNVPIEVEYIYL